LVAKVVRYYGTLYKRTLLCYIANKNFSGCVPKEFVRNTEVPNKKLRELFLISLDIRQAQSINYK